MNVVGAVRQIIINNAGATALLANSTAVYPVVLPQAKVYPAVTIKIGDDRQNNCKGSTTDLDIVEVLIGVFANTYDKAQAVDTAVRSAIDGFSGTIVTTVDSVVHFFEDIRFLYRTDEYDQENQLFYRVVSYKCRYGRTIPAIPLGMDWNAFLDSLTEYDSDEAAGLGGVAIGDVYMTSDNHMSAPGGIPKQRRI